jgi:hypothetical protein
MVFLEIGSAVEGIERVHLELRGVNEQSRSDELLVQLMVPQHVTDVLAKKAFDALPKFLNAIGV